MMEENKEYLQTHNIEGQMPYGTEMTTHYYPRVKKKKGRWSNQEHNIFINCLKTYGKDWDRLEEMIPTRSSLQIRSHCQKYFDQIKKEYKTDNPMEYILKNMCDTSPYYQFDLPQLTDPVPNPQIHRMITKRQIEAAPSEERIDKKKYFKYKKEIASSDSSGYFNREDSSNMKKRELKELMKNMQDSNSSNMSKEKRLQRESNSDSSVKLFKIEKVSKSRTESLSNSNSDLKKMCQEKSVKTSKSKDKRSNKDTRMNIKKGCSILLLNKGKIIIQGNRIESSIPVELQKYDGDINTVIPDYPCQILIEPLTTSRSLSRSQENFKGTSQSMKGENVKPLLTTGSYSTNATSRRTYQQTPMHQDNELMKGMEILQNIFCCCVKR